VRWAMRPIPNSPGLIVVQRHIECQQGLRF
jgi:hypothetical protein